MVLRMRRLKKWLSLSHDRRCALTLSFALVGLVRLGLTILPFKIWLAIVRKLICIDSPLRDYAPAEVKEISRDVKTASRWIPGAYCLTQAIAVQILLSRRKIASQLVIGVNKNTMHGFKAHAWVKIGNRLVIGGEGSEEFAPLLQLGKEPA
jgi:hypothetical protein